jgi:copper chaperone
MTNFVVNDMTCGHCVSTITKTLKALDPQAQVTIDLGQRLVQVESASVAAATLRSAIAKAGYTPEPVTGVQGLAAERARAGGCCGGCH